MYKNFNSSTDYTKNAFEQFTNKSQVNTRFSKDSQSYNNSAAEKRSLDRKDVNLKKIKPDTNIKMKKPSSFTPKKIKVYGTILGIIIMMITILKFYLYTVDNEILVPAIVSIFIIIFLIFHKRILGIIKKRRRRNRR